MTIGSVPLSSFAYPLDQSLQALDLKDTADDSGDEDYLPESFTSPLTTSIRRTATMVECTLGHRVFEYALIDGGPQKRSGRFKELMRGEDEQV